MEQGFRIDVSVPWRNEYAGCRGTAAQLAPPRYEILYIILTPSHQFFFFHRSHISLARNPKKQTGKNGAPHHPSHGPRSLSPRLRRPQHPPPTFRQMPSPRNPPRMVNIPSSLLPKPPSPSSLPHKTFPLQQNGN